MGIVPPENQLLEMVKRTDEWTRRDYQLASELELDQARLSRGLSESCMEYKALFALYGYAFNKYFKKSHNRIHLYHKEEVIGDRGILVGHDIIHCDSDGPPTRILLGCRCPKPFCIAYDRQCVHELVNDK